MLVIKTYMQSTFRIANQGILVLCISGELFFQSLDDTHTFSLFSEELK